MVYKCPVSDLWIVEPAIVFIGNKFHPCAVLVPLDDDVGREIIRHVVDMGVAIAGFCKTANIGIEKVICNVLANPNIRWIVVAGHENPGHKSGKAIVMLHRYGIDPKTRRIMCGPDNPCTDIPTGYIPNIPLEAVERFRRQIKVVDILIDGKEVTEENVLELTCLTVHGTTQEPKNRIKLKIKSIEYELYDPGAFDTKPYKTTITDRESTVESIGTDHAFIRTYSIQQLEKEIKKLIKNNIRKNIVIIYGKCDKYNKQISRYVINRTDLILSIVEYEDSITIRGLFTKMVNIREILNTILELESKYRKTCDNVCILLTVPEILDN